jgi:hypothetical protein
VRGVTPGRPHARDDLPVDRERERARARSNRCERCQRRLAGALIDAERAQFALGKQALDAGRVRALGKPESARGPEAPAVRAQPRVELEPAARGGGDERKHGVRGGGCDQLHPRLALRGPKWRQQVAADRIQPRERAGVERNLGAGGGSDVRRLGVALGRREAVVAQEATQAVGDARRLELVGEHGRDRHRQVVCHLEHRQVGARVGVEQPLLSERIRPEALDVGHVRVQHERQVPYLTHDRWPGSRGRYRGGCRGARSRSTRSRARSGRRKGA